ncbi:MAG: diguanylate cyclase [Candidatus Omnitrophica bacterium CG02_land_8_20_14_3_00__42_8]|nr:MAG: diguanylate cyclase [Candidatus Omnitrophica bacterium CG02_land_8_20_14_3_00__42_8]
MKICIPTETNKGKDAQAYSHFGSAPYFTIYDTEKKTAEVIDNSNQHHAHGTCHPMNALNGKKVDAVVCGGMGMRAVQKLNESGIKAYMAHPGTVEDIVNEFKQNSLKEITISNSCAQHGCH